MSLFSVLSLNSVYKGLQSDVSRLLIKSVPKVRGHAIAQQFLHRPHVVRQTCRHSRRDRLPLLG